MRSMTIGQISKLTSNTVVTLRYYEKCGLLPDVRRSAAGYRLYPDSTIARLYFIKNAKIVGFSLDEIAVLLNLYSSNGSSSDIKSEIKKKKHLVEQKIKYLQKIKKELSKLDQSCDGRIPIKDCPIIEALSKVEGGRKNQSSGL